MVNGVDQVDPIEDIQSRFEAYPADSEQKSSSGEQISADFLRVIELSQKAGTINSDDKGKLNGSITRLNGRAPIIRKILEDPELVDAYEYVVAEINEITASDVRLVGTKRIKLPS